MRRTVAYALFALLAACGGRPAATPGDGGADAATGGGDAAVVPGPPSNQLDVLFVMDNSNSDFGDGRDLGPVLSSLLTPLAAHPGLSVHVGIVTSDLGAGVFTPPSCDTVGGDQGMLQNAPNSPACSQAHLADPAGRFLALTLGGDGGVTDENFVGGVDDVFRCYGATGAGGCGFEHQLGSARAALAGCASAAGCSQPANSGFLRPDAYLLLVVMTTEDDCSAPPDSTLFDPTQTALASTVGPLTSYRCFEFGVLCGGQDVGRTFGDRADCAPGNKDPNPRHQLVPVATFARDFKALKVSPRMVYAAVFAGPPTPVSVQTDSNGFPDLQPSCIRGGGIWDGSADPAIRLEAFTHEFDADRARFFDACTAGADSSFAQIGSDLAAALRGD